MKKIFLFIFTLIISLICLDLFLKLTRITPPTLKYYNPIYGSLNRHNIQYLKSVEGFYLGNTNYDGRFRENYPKRKSDKKTLRIILLGDSFVEGIDVFSKNHFAQYIEKVLGKKLNRKVEVLNFGRGNCTLHAASYYFINYIQKEYDADIVLIFTDGRDIYDIKESYSYPSTCYKFDQNGNLVAGDIWKRTAEYKLSKLLNSIPLLKYYDYSAHFRLLYRAVARTKINGLAAMTLGKFYNTPQKEMTYQDVINNNPISELSKKLYDTVYKYDRGQVVYITKSKPIATPAIDEYLAMKKYNHINITDTFSNFTIKNTNINGYFFKATKTYGGHWNNDGHKAVGNFLANKIFYNMNSYNMPGYEK